MLTLLDVANNQYKFLFQQINALDDYFQNKDLPLHMSCANGHSSSTQQLLLASSLTTCPNQQGDYPLHLAVRYGHATATKLLIAAKCNLNVQNEVKYQLLSLMQM